MTTLENLKSIGLNTENCIVIGSGVLSAYGIRDSNDIDVVTNEDNYSRLAKEGQFDTTENHGNNILSDGIFEIGTGWTVLGKTQHIEDLMKVSIVLDNVRYISLQFLLEVKRSWLLEDDVRQKDIADVKLIEDYLATE